MINAKKANALLWTGNVLLIIAIVAFAFQFLIFPDLKTREDDPPITVPPYTNTLDPTDTQALARLPNPLLPPKEIDKPSVARGPIRLIGTDRIEGEPDSDTAYLTVVNRNLNVNAYVGEPIRDEAAGQEVSELSGWKLKSVTPKTATFSTPSGDQKLEMEDIVAAAPTGGPNPPTSLAAGQPWESNRYASKKNPARSNDAQEAWDIDKKEIEWITANVDSILRDVSLEPYPGGGLKINALPEGGFAAERGLRAGDVVRSVNGQPIESMAKLAEVTKGLSRNATTLTVQVDRSGRIYTLTYTVPRR